MTLQTVFYDSDGWVRSVEDGESRATVHGCEKAVSDTGVHGELTIRHTVTVKDGEVVSAELQPEPEPTTEQWYKMISQRADRELQRGVSVTVNGTTYGIRTGPQALALIDGAAIRADVSIRNSRKIERLVPTDKGMTRFDQDALWQIFEAVESHQQAVSARVEELQTKVADGTITSDDLDSGWP